MAKVTSKLQLTVPKAIADRYGIRPGDELDWAPAGDAIRVTPPGHRKAAMDVRTRLWLFEQATDRQRRRQARQVKTHKPEAKRTTNRGWMREALYARGRAR